MAIKKSTIVITTRLFLGRSHRYKQSTIVITTRLFLGRRHRYKQSTILITTRLFLGRSYCYKQSTMVITNWLFATTYTFLIWQWILSLLGRFVLHFINNMSFTGIAYTSNMVGVL